MRNSLWLDVFVSIFAEETSKGLGGGQRLRGKELGMCMYDIVN